MGGKCCPYTAACRAGGSCLATEAPTTAAPATTPGADDACSPSRTRCQDGTGCCSRWQRCTRLSGTTYCAAASRLAGAKAAVGATAAVAVGFLVGAVFWLCISKRTRRRRRRRRRRPRTAPRSPDAAPAAGPTEVRGLSETARMPRPRPGRGLTEDYCGPSPVACPYTDTATLYELRMSLPALARARRSRPETPGDIVAPVEMDSPAARGRPRPSSRGHGEAASPCAAPTPPASTPGPFELYGSEAYPDPPSSSLLPLLAAPDTPQMDDKSRRSGT